MNLEYWKNRPKTYLIKWLMEKGDITVNEAAVALGISKACFNNKLNRNSFSIEETIALAYTCGYEMTFRVYDDSIDQETGTLFVSPAMFCDDKVYERINKVYEMRKNRIDKANEVKRHKDEYLRMKNELAEFKLKYNIKD